MQTMAHDIHYLTYISFGGPGRNAQLCGHVLQGLVHQFMMEEKDPEVFRQAFRKLKEQVQQLFVIYIERSCILPPSPEPAVHPGLSFFIGHMPVDGIPRHCGKIKGKVLYVKLLAFMPQGEKNVLYDLFGVLGGLQAFMCDEEQLFPIQVVYLGECLFVAGLKTG